MKQFVAEGTIADGAFVGFVNAESGANVLWRRKVLSDTSNHIARVRCQDFDDCALDGALPVAFIHWSYNVLEPVWAISEQNLVEAARCWSEERISSCTQVEFMIVGPEDVDLVGIRECDQSNPSLAVNA